MLRLAGRVLVVGAARSGLAAAEALTRLGQPVRLYDQRGDLTPILPGSVERRLGHYTPDSLLDGISVVVRSPGVPASADVIRQAAARSVPIWSEVELGWRLLAPGVRVVGVTGTNGKTTTTELVAEMLRSGGAHPVTAGNVGTPLSGVASSLTAGTILVLELSSFQLEDVHTLRCDTAVLLNVTPDHLDRHHTLAAYGELKLRIFARQRRVDTAVLNADDEWVAALRHLPGNARVVRTAAADAEAVGFAHSRLVGDHNRANAAAAAAVASSLGVTSDAIRAGLAAFRPVAHRLEYVGEHQGVRYFDDSKATNPDAAIKALTAFVDGRVRLILGGSDKQADFAALAAALPGRVAAVYLTGPAGDRIATLLKSSLRVVRGGTLEQAFVAAADDAQPGDVVLLSPACASFDEFTDYAERGERFVAMARARGAQLTAPA